MAIVQAPENVLEAARTLAPSIIACRDEIERERCLPPALLEQLHAAGMFRLQTPCEYGGYELDFPSFMRVVEEIARADGSAGWNVSILNGGLVCGTVPESTAGALFAANPDTRIPGSFNERNGRAEPLPGGYRVSGRWTFVSGCRHADWLNFACVVTIGGEPLLAASGRRQVIRALVPRAKAEIIDTWHVGGLRGTGSHDVTVAGVFVPDEYVALNPPRPTRRGPLWEFPPISSLGLGFVSVGLGVARTAIATLTEMAGSKQPHRATGLLRERAMVQADVARAEVLLESARGYLYSRVQDVWDTTARGETPSIEQRALLRAGVVHAAESAAQVVDLMYRAGGGTSIYEHCPLERCFRDVHTLTQQIMLQPQHWESVGRALLGLEPGAMPF